MANENWFMLTLWEFVHYALLVVCLTVGFIAWNGFFIGYAGAVIIMEIPVAWLSDKLILYGVFPLFRLFTGQKRG